MRNPIPLAVIAAAALAGLFGWGLTGLIVGAIGGFFFSIAFALLLHLFSVGRVVPRDVLKQTATRFLTLHSDLTLRAFPNTSQAWQQRFVEHNIELLFRRAAGNKGFLDFVADHDVTAMRAAAAELIAEQVYPEKIPFLATLAEHIERDLLMSS